MKKKKTTKDVENYVLTLPISVEFWQACILDKRHTCLRRLYNYAQRVLLNHYNIAVNTNAYKNVVKAIKDKVLSINKREKKLESLKDTMPVNEYKKQMSELRSEYKGIKNPLYDFFRNYTFTVSRIHSKDNTPDKFTFTEFGILSFATKLASKRNRNGSMPYKELGINTANLSAIGNALWAAWEKKLYSKNESGDEIRLHFKRWNESVPIVSKMGRNEFVGMQLRLEDFSLKVKTNGRTGKLATWMTLELNKNHNWTSYEMYALEGGVKSVKTVSIFRKPLGMDKKYYLQLTMEGHKPDKGRLLGTGNVGIDLGRSTVAVSSNSSVFIDKLAQRVDNIEYKLAVIERAMDRSRRKLNPQNYNADGTVKRGIKLIWHRSGRYEILCKKREELHRKQAAIRKQCHIDEENRILSLGNKFVIEKNDFRTMNKEGREKVTNQKTGKVYRKKWICKSLANHAPSMFKTILKNKVESLGGSFIEVPTDTAASQYDFTNDSYTKHDVSVRKVTLSDGKVHQRDMLAAFNLQHLEGKVYNRKVMINDYRKFCEMESKEMTLYRDKIKKGDKQTIGV